MKNLYLKCFSIFFCFLSICLYAQNDVKDVSTGETFPLTVSFEHEGKEFHLQATGVATRKKFFVKVYSVAHYLQEGSGNSGADKIQRIMQDDNAKELFIKWVHNVSAAKVQDGYQESFKNAVSENVYSQIQNDVDKYIHFFSQDVQKGDEHVLRWLPGGIIEILFNGKKIGNITNKDFAQGLWSIWFGTKSVVDRNHLISLMK